MPEKESVCSFPAPLNRTVPSDRDLFVQIQVKEAPAYAAVAGNAGGSTPKELFEDLIEELTTQVG